MPDPNRRRLLLGLAAGLLAPRAAEAAEPPRPPRPPLDAPNVVPISPTLVTSGQPTAEALATVHAHGFEAVIYLAPTTVEDAVPGEEAIVRAQGIEWIHIPIVFSTPTEADFRRYAETLQRLGSRRVLVHCQVNFRASSMTFLYRAIVLKDDPEQAWEAVSRVWVPSGPWAALIGEQLAAAGIAFRPL